MTQLGMVRGLAAVALLLILRQVAAAQETANSQISPPEDILVETKDGVRIKATFYPGRKGKDSVPVIVVHDYNGTRQDMAELALTLQKDFGHAVIAPDLRGHGESTTANPAIRTDPKRQKLNASSMMLDEYPLMWKEDLERIKSWLVAKNNAAELNIDKLSIVGAGMGAIVGALFAARDYSWPMLATGKQGQDVKAIAMISPEFVFKNLSMQEALKSQPLQRDVSIYVLVGGADSRATADANRVYQAFSGHRKKVADIKDQTTFFSSLKTKLQGEKLLTEPALGVSTLIGQFIEVRSGTQPYPWLERPNPLG
ncbi:MAG TPA: alpha/beta fold hydrolase [Pirellulales bacterium]|nr:alpha/beta fold hydrolase [Pirellulales bacterium]